MKKLLLGFLALSVFLAGLLWAQTAWCRKKDTGNDVVILLDSSGSMKKTDPESLRIPAAKLFISLLNKKDQVGVVSFDEECRLLCPFTAVDDEKDREKLAAAVEKVTSSGLYTDLHAALEKGIQLFSQRPETSERSRILLLMTDGKMDVGDPAVDARLVERIKKEHVKYFKKNGIRVYSIAFTEHSEMKLLQKISKGSGGFNTFAPTAKDLHRTFTALFESLKAPDMLPVEGDKFLVDGSIDEVTIIAEKSSVNTGITLQSPSGENYTAQKEEKHIKWFVSDNFDMITVQEPAPGAWRILYSSGKKDKVYIVTDLKMRSSFNQSYVQVGEPVLISAWLQQFGSTITRRDILEKIEFYTEISTPDGEPVRIELYDKGRKGDERRGDGIHSCKYVPLGPEAYVATVVAKGNTFERKLNLHFKVMEPVEEELNEEAAQDSEEPQYGPEPVEATVEGEPAEEKQDKLALSKILGVFLMANFFILGSVFGFVKLRERKGLAVKPSPKKKKAKKKKGEEKKELPAKEEAVEEEEPTEEQEKILTVD